MEYTKDAIFNIKYVRNFNLLGFKKRGIICKIKNIIQENKFILIILTVLTVFLIADISLINMFMNLLVNL